MGSAKSFCGHDHTYASPHHPANAAATTYTYVYDTPVKVSDVIIEQHQNGINCVQVTVDGSDERHLESPECLSIFQAWHSDANSDLGNFS